MNENKDNAMARVMINGNLVEVPLKALDDGSLVPSIELAVRDGKIKPRYVPGNFPWKWPNVK